MSATARQRIIQLLERTPLELAQLALELKITEKEILAHLPHVAKTLTARGLRLRIEPAACSLCGFEFKDRRRLSPPGRCPRCKQSRIRGPWYHIPHATG